MNQFRMTLAAGVVPACLWFLVVSAAPAVGGGPPPEESARRSRPAAGAMRVEEVSPELQRTLELWYQNTSQVTTLNGRHQRFKYDVLYNIETRAEGVFYYEAPDKGRIDIEGAQIGRGEVSKRMDRKTGKPFALKSDTSEKWISTGREIREFNGEEKTVAKFEIPAESRGSNIMDGPLPFLFGMPPEKAKRRYVMELLPGRNPWPNDVWLNVKPRWKQDASSWKVAKVILSSQNYLPKAVQMVDPSGNLETVYTFHDLKVNKPRSILPWVDKDPFDPPVPRGYKVVMTKVDNQIQKTASVPQPGSGVRRVADATSDRPDRRNVAPAAMKLIAVPSVANMHFKEAEKLLKNAGFTANGQVKLHKGRAAAIEKAVYVVYEQHPKAGARVAPETTIHLRLFDKVGAKPRQ